MIYGVVFGSVGFLLAGWCGWQTYQGFKKGEMPIKGDNFSRANQPKMFWTAAIVNALLMLVGIVFGLVGFLAIT